MPEDCIFCKIVAGDIPSKKVYEDDEYLAFHDVNPQAPTHVLIIPRRHLPGIAHAEPGDADLLGRLLLKANDIAEQEGLTKDGFRYVINNGEQGGQTVPHLHLHILGGRPMTWPPG